MAKFTLGLICNCFCYEMNLKQFYEAKKHLGQHFLTSRYAERIAESVPAAPVKMSWRSGLDRVH